MASTLSPAPTEIDPAPASATPGLARRMACFAYEGTLLFGVLMISGYLYSSLTQQRHALHGRLGMQLFIFLVLGIYFVWFWSRGGQTVAMKAWHIRLVGVDGQPVPQGRALARYLLSWLWFAPALLWAWVTGVTAVGPFFALLAAGMLTYALLSLLHPRRQFLHDAVCRTQLVTHRPARK